MDLNKIISGLASSGVLGGLAGGAVGGALMSNKKVRKNAGTLLKVGGIAAMGTMAWKAYQGYQSNQGEASGAASDVAPATPAWQGLEEKGFALEPSADTASGSPQLLLVQAMIAAACADGHLDSDERGRVMSRIEQLSLAPDEKALVFDALQSPPSMAWLCEQVKSPELAAEVFLSSLVAVDRERPESRLYLDALAFRLGLPQGLTAQMQADLESQQLLAAT